ncbi:glycosyltransferase family 2 protein [Streptomyces sp. BK239]|uniref:glycosyltransferase family 2 protein n=1 Tax=Streptomyces sp. BK239 TaxID=2512155 RepID=UPI0013EF56D2|nr:glycosyltransferase family 2 protein [Streptomyces sp. BK239]
MVIPVFNAMPYLEQTLASVARQSIGMDAVEVVAVDDGSTDGSGEVLDAWAKDKPWRMTVVHQEASGGPSRPRNVGLDHATGRYVFFLDGDDCLGPETLERLVAMAEKNGADTVLGKLVGVGRVIRPEVREVFAKNVDRADKAAVYYTLMPFKLFRRAMLEEHGLRFPEHMRISEDQHFVARAYLHSEVISIVADYDCYYLVRRGDNGNITLGGLDYPTMVAQAAETVELVTGLTEPGPTRDRMVARHAKAELLRRFDRRFLAAGPEERKELADLAAPHAHTWVTPGVLAELDVAERLRVHCLREGLLDELAAVVEWDMAGRPGKALARGGRLYAPAPFPPVSSAAYEELCDITDAALGASPRRRLDKVGWDGSVVELSGYAYLDQVDTGTLRTEVLLRHTGTERELVLPARLEATPHLTVSRGKETYDFGLAGFRASVDLAAADDGRPLGPGTWEVSLRCAAEGLTARGGLGTALGADVPRQAEQRVVVLPRADGDDRPHTVSVGPKRGRFVVEIRPVPEPPSMPIRIRRGLGRVVRRVRGGTRGA